MAFTGNIFLGRMAQSLATVPDLEEEEINAIDTVIKNNFYKWIAIGYALSHNVA
jgi:hypothetical protein